MHKIPLAQKGILHVNLFGSKNIAKGTTYFRSQVVFCKKKSDRQFASLSKSSLVRDKKAFESRDNCNFDVLKKNIQPEFGHFTRSSTSDTSSDSENDNQQKKDYSFDALGAWDHRIDLPILMEASIKHGAPIPLILASDVGCSSILGKRTYQEDRLVMLCHLNSN